MRYIFVFLFCCVANAQIEFKTFKGLPVVPLELNGKVGLFLIDTGSVYSIIDMNIRRRYGFKVWKDNRTANGIGGSVIKIYNSNIKQVIYKDKIINITFKSADLSDLKRQLHVIGIIGSDWINKNDIVIDFKNKVLWQRR